MTSPAVHRRCSDGSVWPVDISLSLAMPAVLFLLQALDLNVTVCNAKDESFRV